MLWASLSEPRRVDLLQTVERLQRSDSVMVLTVMQMLGLMTEAHLVVPPGFFSHVPPAKMVYQSQPLSMLVLPSAAGRSPLKSRCVRSSPCTPFHLSATSSHSWSAGKSEAETALCYPGSPGLPLPWYVGMTCSMLVAQPWIVPQFTGALTQEGGRQQTPCPFWASGMAPERERLSQAGLSTPVI